MALEQLDLSHNQITQLPDQHIFADLGSLRELNLMGNEIRELSGDNDGAGESLCGSMKRFRQVVTTEDGGKSLEPWWHEVIHVLVIFVSAANFHGVIAGQFVGTTCTRLNAARPACVKLECIMQRAEVQRSRKRQAT